MSTFQKWPALLEALVKRSDKPEEIKLASATVKYADIRMVPIHGRGQRVSGYLVALQDISERGYMEAALEAQTRELERQAITDDLTGLSTRSHPMGQDLRQGVKALANTVRALRLGGTMITLVRAEEGVGVFGLANRKLPVSRSGLQWLTPAILPSSLVSS